MSPEKEAELVAIYPPIFANPSNLSCINLFGFECGDGWFDILKQLIQRLQAILEDRENRIDTNEDFPITVSQVKEKYGTLRFYMSCSTDPMDDAIGEAEKKSANTCENCGKPGTWGQKNHWYMVRCEECWTSALR